MQLDLKTFKNIFYNSPRLGFTGYKEKQYVYQNLDYYCNYFDIKGGICKNKNNFHPMSFLLLCQSMDLA